MAATSDEAMESLLSNFNQICDGYRSGVSEFQLLKSSLNAEMKKRECLEFNFNSLKSENERLAKMSIESLNKLADQLEHRTSYQSLKEELKRASDDLVRKENECRNAIESLEQDHAMRINELETQVRDLSSQKAANEATINELHQDLATHRNHIEALKSRLERIHSYVESRYHYEIQDLKDCLLIEQEEKNEQSKKLQDLEKELLISRTKLVEHHRDLTSNRHVETLKQKIMKLRKENEVLKRQQFGFKKG